MPPPGVLVLLLLLPSPQVASRAVPGLLLLTSIAECSSDEVAPQPMNSIAAAALLNLLQLLLVGCRTQAHTLTPGTQHGV